MPETSIILKLEDRYSSVMKQLAQATRSFDKDSEHLEQTLHDLSGEKSILAAETDKARKVMKEAQKQFALTGDEADAFTASLAGQEYEDYRRKLELVNKTLKETEKQIAKVEGISKQTGVSMKSGIGEVVNALAANGIGDMVSQIAQESANALVSSAFGAENGIVFSNSLSSAISGGAIGTMIAPGIGTAIGAAAGAGAGLLTGVIQNVTAQDENFKDYYNSLYDTAKQSKETTLTSGSALAGQREKDTISFSTLFGSQETAQTYLNSLTNMANITPFLYDDLTAMSKTLASYGYKADSILPVLQTVGDTGAALDLGVSDMNAIATALGRMKSSGKTTLEYLNILNDRRVNAVEILANAHGVDQGTMYEMISDGELNGQESVQYILEALKEMYSGSMLEQSKTFEGRTSTLEGMEQQAAAAMGEGYNELRGEGLDKAIASWGGELGLALQDLNRISGENAAYLENLKEEYTRQALSAVLLGETPTLFQGEDQKQLAGMREQYADASKRYREDGDREAALKMEELRTVAEGMAQAAFEASDQYKLTQEAEAESLAALRENTSALEAASSAYSLAQERTKGGVSLPVFHFAGEGSYTDSDSSNYSPIAAAFWDDSEEGDVSRIVNPRKKPSGGIVQWESDFAPYFLNSNAAGIRRVPYDGYPALLHEDERVLTARETRTLDILPAFPSFSRNSASETPAPAAEPVTVTVNVSGNTFGGDMSPEDIADAIAEQAAAQLAEALTRKRLAGWR